MWTYYAIYRPVVSDLMLHSIDGVPDLLENFNKGAQVWDPNFGLRTEPGVHCRN